MRRLGSVMLIVLLGMLPGSRTHAQIVAAPSPPVLLAELPEAPIPQIPVPPSNPSDSSSNNAQLRGTIQGSVVDGNGSAVEGALVVLVTAAGQRQSTSSGTLGVFQFEDVEPGAFAITVASKGFATWTSARLTILPGQIDELPPTTLQVAAAVSNVDVTATQYDIAEEQVQLQEGQRVLGFIPNFYVSYIWNAAPLTSGQKFRLALHSSIDPVTIGISAGVAGVQQWQNDFKGYGQGAQGYAKRFGASYANSVIDAMVGGAILPSVLHQDPRYFYKGTGSIRSRALYAISTIVICKGDNGKWQPNYSNVLGNLASAGISNIYYPDSDKEGAALTIENALIGTAEGAIGNLFEEFLVKKISKGVPSAAMRAAGATP